ncbi:hypothetical protein ABZ412_34270 [Nocardia sp. NPDC005746]|uniref:hypothetical protein n=1 Tax=Nocardia sp. NPDC005746 TaxID=3157062 RepID=UPI00340EB8CE
MIAWLAADPVQTGGVSWKDFLSLGAPVATITAALIAGAFLLRNTKKTPYDRLDLLVKVRSTWPDEVDGIDTVDRSIGRALAEIRTAEGAASQPSESADEQAADRQLARELRSETILSFVGTVLAVVAAVGNYLYDRSATGLGISAIAIGLGTGLFIRALGNIRFLYRSTRRLNDDAEIAMRAERARARTEPTRITYDY